MLAAAVAQGGFFGRGQLAAAGLLGAAVVAALPLRRASNTNLRLPLVACGLLTGWILLRAIPGGSLAAAGREVLLLGGLATVVMLCRRLDRSGRRVLLTGLLCVGVVVAVAGWVGVVWRLSPWALRAHGLWGAASTLTYANATAAVLVPLTLTALALRVTRPRHVPLALVLMVLCTGVALTLSRAAALALLIGLGVLIALRGWIVLRVLLAPLGGAVVTVLGLLPSLPVSAQPRPALAVTASFVGMGLTAVVVRGVGRRSTLTALAAVVLVAIVVVGRSNVGSAPLGEAGLRVWDKRVTFASPVRADASSAALGVIAKHPLNGVGPGRALVLWRDDRGRLHVHKYIHNEYLQVVIELGAVGAALLIALLVGMARTLWRSRRLELTEALWPGVVAACVAAAVHGGLDFVWHVPAVLLTLALLVGLAAAPATSESRVA